MKKLSHPVVIVLLAALVSACAPKSGTTGSGSGTAGWDTPVRGAGAAGSGASPTGAAPQAVVDEHWPRETSSGGDHVTMYQPQVDAWDGSLLRAHAAVAVKTGDAKIPPTFGVVGGSKKGIALQPVSIEGLTGANVAAGVVEVELKLAK